MAVLCTEIIHISVIPARRDILGISTEQYIEMPLAMTVLKIGGVANCKEFVTAVRAEIAHRTEQQDTFECR